MNNKKQIFTIALSVIITVFCVAIIAKATTIGNNVSVSGTLDVSSTSTLATTTTTFLTSLGLSVTDFLDFNNTDYTTKFGYQAGKNIVSGAQRNDFFGYQAGLSSATLSTNAADDNSGFGYQALNLNTTGNFNAAYGSFTLKRNTSGSYNVAQQHWFLQSCGWS